MIVVIITNPPRLSHVPTTFIFYTNDENRNQTSTKEVEMSTNTTVAHNWIKLLPFAVILLAVALTLSLVFANSQPVVRLGSPVSGSESSIQRGIEADAARYTAMAEYYNAQKESVALGIQADAARYTAMTDFYPAWRESLDRVHETDAARYTGMSAFYAEWMDGFRQVHEADAARYTAMAKYYSGK